MNDEEENADVSADRLVRDALSRANAALPPSQAPVRTPRCARDSEVVEHSYEVMLGHLVRVNVRLVQAPANAIRRLSTSFPAQHNDCDKTSVTKRL